jgi:hypothetical protein
VGVSPVAGVVFPVQREKPNGNNPFLEKFYSGCLLDGVEYLFGWNWPTETPFFQTSLNPHYANSSDLG